jgi:hypothetical protein
VAIGIALESRSIRRFQLACVYNQKRYLALFWTIWHFSATVCPDTCRAVRAINWSQQQLAKVANVGVSIVKNFEAAQSAPTANNPGAIQTALEHAGVECARCAVSPARLPAMLKIRGG